MGPLRLAQPMTATLPSDRARPWITVADWQRIRELRHQCGLAQTELVDRAEVSAHTIGRLERRHRTGCRTRALTRIAGALGERPAAIAAVTLTDPVTRSDTSV